MPRRRPRRARPWGTTRANAVAGLLLALLLCLSSAASADFPSSIPSCETGALATSFATTPAAGQVAGESDYDCYLFSDVSAADQIEVRIDSGASNARWSVVDANDQLLCDSTYWWMTTCPLSGGADWRLLVYGAGNETFQYSVAAHRLTSPQGCTALGDPAVWSFAAPRLNGSIDTALRAQCYTFTRAFGEEDGAYWLRALRTAGTVSPRLRVIGPSGAVECAPGTTDFDRCPLLASGQFALVVDDATGGETGSFFATAKRLTFPAGCSTVPSVAFGASPVTGGIATGGEIDCLTLPDVASGDTIELLETGATRWAVVNGAGNAICRDGWGATCQLSDGGDWHLLLYASDVATPTYTIAVRRLTDPLGCSPLGDPEVWSFTAPRLNGSIATALGAQCYTFSRSLGEEDGAYWFRALRTSGTLSPRWRVLGPSASQECDAAWSTDYRRCSLLAAGQFTLIVDDPSGSGTGSYFVTAKRATAPTGCAALASVSFDAAPISGSIATGGEIDCFTPADVAAGDVLDVRATGSTRWALVDGAGDPLCGTFAGSSLCELTGQQGWHLIVYGADAATFAYSLAVRRLTDPQGCSPLGDPDVWSFTAPRLNGAIAGPLDARCYTFSRAPGEEDGSYWFRAGRTSGTLSPAWRVSGPSGAQECHGTSLFFGSCQLLTSGQFTVVVGAGGTGDGQSGSFFLTAKRTTSPAGCAELPSVAFGFGPISGKLGNGGEIDCYSFAASEGDVFSITASGSADALALIGPDGTLICYWWQSQCPLASAGTYTLLAYSSAAAGTGGYTFRGTCENVPCGQSDTAVTDVVPNRVGPSVSTSVLLRGRDLDLLQSVQLVRGADVVEGVLDDPSPDGRATSARFDLHDANAGAWTLQAVFLDGTTRTLAGAVTVEALRPATVSVELVGREVFRAGRPSSVTLELHNSGNIDGLAVPVVLSGIPAGSRVEPQFVLQAPHASGDVATLQPQTFDQQQDTVQLTDGIAVPLFLPRIPAGRTLQLAFRITAPMQGTDYTLRAAAGQCLGAPQAERGLATPSFHTGVPEFTPACGGDLAQAALGLIPGGDCVNTAIDLGRMFWNAVLMPMVETPQGSPVSMMDATSFGLDAIGCGLDLTGVGGVVWGVVEGAGLVASGVQLHGDCWVPQSESQLPQQVVGAFDPNDIVGPAGAGTNRYISGEEPLGYQVLFENIPSATAPAQRVEVVDQLDTAVLDPSTALFEDVQFGSTTYALPYASHQIDEILDLRPVQEMLVHVTAGVTQGGQVHWELQAIDPETLAPPEDPTAGFLPPNVNAPEGEGHVSFTVAPKQQLASGATIANGASIRFDENEPIATPVWTNAIDRQPPSVTVTAEGAANPAVAHVAWGGSDDAAGIEHWEIRVSRDGGPFAPWRSATTPGSGDFVAQQPGTYGFRATARDGADNVATSRQAAVTLTLGSPGRGQTPPSQGDSQRGSATTVDRTAPQVRIVRHPKARVWLRPSVRRARVVFAFRATEVGATFMCKLDRARYVRCRSRLAMSVAAGRHALSVYARDAAGNTGRVVILRFRVLTRR